MAPPRSLTLIMFLLLGAHPACTTGTQSAGDIKSDVRYIFSFNPVAAEDTLTKVKAIAKSKWNFSRIESSLSTSKVQDPASGVRVSFSLRGKGVTTNRVKAMKHLKGAIEEDAHNKTQKVASASGIDFSIETIVVKDDATGPATLVSFVATTTTVADTETLLNVFAVPAEWENLMNSFQARELWKEIVTELAVKCFIPVEFILLENIKTDVVVMQTLTVMHATTFNLTSTKADLKIKIRDTLDMAGINCGSRCAIPVDVFLTSELWSPNEAIGNGSSSNTNTQTPAPAHDVASDSSEAEYPYLIMTTVIVASLSVLVFFGLALGFGKRCLKPLPKDHHAPHAVHGEDALGQSEPEEEIRVDTILMHDSGDKFWVLWKGYQRHKIVPKTLQGKERVQLPTVESKASLNAQDINIISLYEEILQIDEEVLAIAPESEEWVKFEDSLLEAQHEHGMRPMTYAYPHSVNRQLSFSRASAFRQRYGQMIYRRKSGRKKIDLDKPPMMQL